MLSEYASTANPEISRRETCLMGCLIFVKHTSHNTDPICPHQIHRAGMTMLSISSKMFTQKFYERARKLEFVLKICGLVAWKVQGLDISLNQRPTISSILIDILVFVENVDR